MKTILSGKPASWLVPEWPAPPNVHAMVTSRDGPEPSRPSPYGFNVGVHCGDDSAAVRRNRQFLRNALSLPSQPCWLQQVHGTHVLALDRPCHTPPPLAGEGGARFARAGGGNDGPPLAGEGVRRADGGNDTQPPAADASITRMPGVVLAIQTADCLPVLLCADDGSEIAAAHAGWRGLSAGVLENTVEAMRTPRGKILAWLGPAIAAQSYEVGGEVRDAFLARDSVSASAFTAARPGHWCCDLYELARQRLRAAQVPRIFGGGLDTFSDPRFHSYRRDGALSGRMASLIWLAP